MDTLNDAYYMKLALELAANMKGQTGVNPVVGCVVVKGGRIVGLGAHLRQGEGHAEVHALQMAGSQSQGATVYVTLEPCSHHGLTPPCCERIIEAQAARVVVAMTDPNPQVSGRGITRLREHGILVETGVMEAEAQTLNEVFVKYISTGRPFVTLKTASTLDGKIASRTGDSRWVSGPQARELTHTLRHQHAGILIGVSTALADDPQLTTRLPVQGLHPVRVVADSRLRLPPSARMLHDGLADTVVLTTELASTERAQALEAQGAKVLRCGSGPSVDLSLAMRRLAEAGISSILLEGGGRLNGAMLAAGLIDKLVMFFAPKIIGGLQAPASFQFDGAERMADAVRIDRMQVEQIGDDVCITGYPVYKA